MEYVELEVRNADGTVGSFCLVPDADGISHMVMPEGSSAMMMRYRTEAADSWPESLWIDPDSEGITVESDGSYRIGTAD